MNNSDSKKQAVARAAIDFVEYDDVIGFGFTLARERIEKLGKFSRILILL